ncbi:MAG: hypothetical protein WB780_23435, partial [Candidatus Acidiferrales bacterium]
AVAAQQTAQPPNAPIPSPIITGKKGFISNTSGETMVPTGTGDLTYNKFYAAMKSWGRYELVSAPADADLVFEISFRFVVGATNHGGSDRDYEFRVILRDPKSNFVLWAFSEVVPQSSKDATSRKYFDQAMATLVNDLKGLATQPSVDPASQKN